MTDGVWMTKAELAIARRISVGSASRLIRQRRWERQPSDDGRTRVLVPWQWAKVSTSANTTDAGAARKTTTAASIECDRQPGLVQALREEIVRLRLEIGIAQSARHQAELKRDDERQAREAVEVALAEARRQAEHAHQAIEAMQKAQAFRTAEERAEQVTREAAAAQLRRLSEAMATRRSLGLWSRLLLAWRGE